MVTPSVGGCSSIGRAPALQAGGYEFEPRQLHQLGQFSYSSFSSSSILERIDYEDEDDDEDDFESGL